MAATTDRQPVNLPPITPTQTLTPCQAMQAEVAKYGDWDINIIQAIAQAENRTCDPLRHNETVGETHRDRSGNVICVGSYGVLQVGCLHYAADQNRNDLETNINVAHKVWQGSGYTAWTMYKNGTYREFLK